MSINTNKAVTRCFLIAPVGVPLDTLALLLKQREISIMMASGGLSAYEHTESESYANAIEQSDLVVAVIGPPGKNTNSFFLLGYAVALRKRVLIITPTDAEKLPYELRGLPQVAADLYNAEAIGFGLDQLRAAPRPGTLTRNAIAASRPIDRQLSEHLLAQLENSQSERTLADIVSTALRASGVTALVENQTDASQSQIDIGVWADELDSSIGNPLIIELKRNLQHPSSLDSAKQQVDYYLRSTHTRTALILYHLGPPVEESVIRSTPAILLLPIAELLARLQKDGFGAIIHDLRNRVVHGIAA